MKGKDKSMHYSLEVYKWEFPLTGFTRRLTPVSGGEEAQ